MSAVSRLIDLQAAANTHGWTITAMEISKADAEQMAVELDRGGQQVELGPFGVVDGITLTVVPDWSPT